MKSGRLLGHDHHAIDAVAAVAQGPAAITLCRGGAEKTYSYTDPNEDAVGFAIGEGGLVAAVADGHFGARGAECAVEWVLDRLAPEWTAASAPFTDESAWKTAAATALRGVHRAVLVQGASLGVPPAPTTLSLVLVRPDAGCIVHASMGDSPLFRVSPGSPRESADDEAFVATDIGWASSGVRGCYFVGEQYENDEIEDAQFVTGCDPLQGVSALVLASDGLSERGIGVREPEAAAAEAVAHGFTCDDELRPLEACKHVTEAAMASHRTHRSGDNICAAVLWLAEEGGG